LIVQPRAGGEPATDIQISDRTRSQPLGIHRKIDEDGGRGAIGIGIQNECADMRVKTLQIELWHLLQAAHHAQGLAVLRAKSELRPDRVRARVNMDAQCYRNPGRGGAPCRDIADQEKLIEIVDLDHRSLGDGALEDGTALKRAVEDDIGARDAVATRFFIFEIRHHFGDRAFLVKDSADCIEIIGLVRPRKLHIGIAAVECTLGLAIFFAQGGFGKYKQRAAMLGYKRGDGDAVNFRAGRCRAEPEGVYMVRADASDGGRDVWIFHSDAILV